MPFERTGGFADRPLTHRRWIAPARALGCGASQGLLVEQPPAAGANLALDVVRNPSTLPYGMDGDGAVLVTLEGHSISSG
jgi:hypothetical protein